MNFGRILRHLFGLPGAVARAFPPAAMSAIEKAIARGEDEHRGEIRFAAEATLDPGALFSGRSARQRAIDVFSELRIWDTEENNGVLIYLLLADHDVEIVADRGLNAKVGAGEWEQICHRMEAAFAQGDFQRGALDGVREISALLTRHYPARLGDRNELPDRPAIL